MRDEYPERTIHGLRKGEEQVYGRLAQDKELKKKQIKKTLRYIKGQWLRAVSYTHLDVYKRQV